LDWLREPRHDGGRRQPQGRRAVLHLIRLGILIKTNEPPVFPTGGSFAYRCKLQQLLSLRVPNVLLHGSAAGLFLLHLLRLHPFVAARPVAVRFGGFGAATLGGTSPATATDLSHMSAVHADLLASFPTGGTRLVGGEFVRLPLFMGRPSALSSDLALAMSVHGGKAAVLRSRCGFHFDTDSLHPA
jgi:hypothetical protein